MSLSLEILPLILSRSAFRIQTEFWFVKVKTEMKFGEECRDRIRVSRIRNEALSFDVCGYR